VPEFKYRFDGDTPQIFRGRRIEPGDMIEADDELVHGHFTPTSSAAISAAKATSGLGPAPQSPTEPQSEEESNTPAGDED
jgi:hypothetical protein